MSFQFICNLKFDCNRMIELQPEYRVGWNSTTALPQYQKSNYNESILVTVSFIFQPWSHLLYQVITAVSCLTAALLWLLWLFQKQKLRSMKKVCWL